MKKSIFRYIEAEIYDYPKYFPLRNYDSTADMVVVTTN